MEVITDDITIINSSVDTLIIHNSKKEGIKTSIENSTIGTLIVKGFKLTINTSVDTKINNNINGEIAVLNQ